MNDALLSSPSARELLAAGVPREEVLAGLQAQAASAAGSGSTTYAPPVRSPEGSSSMLPVQRLPSARFEEPLPPGWEERFDPSSGRKFYVDFVNQATSWTRPASHEVTPRESVLGSSTPGRASWQLDVAGSAS